jgi:tRNA (guanine-N7-)-methyltransferase
LLETLLPQLRLQLQAGADPRGYFSTPVRDVWLEIGFGAGEHLLWQVQHHPDTGLIGAEPYVSGVAKLLSKLSFPLSPTAGRGALMGRLLIHDDDARMILDALPDASLGRVFILFPDPWPKTRHHKRRFIQMESLDALARVMRSGAELRFASDDADYLSWTLERLMAHRAFAWTAARPNDWHTRPADWPQTRYEAKALHGPPAFLRFVRQ